MRYIFFGPKKDTTLKTEAEQKGSKQSKEPKAQPKEKKNKEEP